MLALQRAQLLLVEDLVDEALVAHRHDVAVLGGRDAGRLLAAMLERVEREVGQPGDLLLRREDAEDAALVTGSFAGVEEGVLVHGRSCTVATRPAAPAPTRRNLRGARSPLRRRARRYPGPDVRQRPRPDRPPADPRAHRARGEAAQRGDAEVRRDLPRAHDVLSGGVASSYQLRDPWPIYLERGRRPEGLGRRRQRVPRLPQRLRLDGPGPRAPRDRRARSRSATRAARTSPPRPRTRSSSPRSSSAAGAWRAGATRTPARSRRWTRSGSRAPTRAATP